ncbi:hypothetical protein BDW22DRAFT_975356 [Trametopsis cervina]|nr:hypothetical protein BDW22DRAFT_975356 [Trametopsis cervina]
MTPHQSSTVTPPLVTKNCARMTSRRPVYLSGRRLFQYRRSSRKSASTSRSTLGSQENPVHVLDRDAAIGWAAIAKALEDYDKDEIEGVKNDIDTLLVFIGLFSAVLSAFLAVVVTLLQEDIPGATLTTLRQMSAQNANYTIQGDFVHSTSPAPTSSTPFEPSANAIRINDLWAASLVISLATASFGILVKQWLREYMKFVTSFPQGRLRIRNFRRTGLETWKVLIIAAFLPLLLQLALGLFFVGLCFYTAELHSSVRNTTLPLVAGWGFIFFFVTVSPLFSEHCPYKTPALNSLVVTVRASMHTLRIAAMHALFMRANSIRQNAPSDDTVKTIARAVKDWVERHSYNLKDDQNNTQPYSEATAATFEAGDLDIMLDADKLQGNDEIVRTAMGEALQQTKATPQGIIKFILDLLKHRIEWNDNGEPQIINCSMATTLALDSIYSILKQHLPISDLRADIAPPNTNSELSLKVSWTLSLYLSLWTHPEFARVHPPPHPPPWEPINSMLKVFAQVAVSAPSAPGPKFLLSLTCHWCRELKLDLSQSLTRIKDVIETYSQAPESTDRSQSNNDKSSVLNGDSLGETVVFLVDLMRNDLHSLGGKFDGVSGAVQSIITSSKAKAAEKTLLMSY